MKTLRLHGPGDLRLHNEPTLIPGEGEACLNITAVGICGSDLHWFNEAGIGDSRLEKPLVLGHEFTAVIENGQRVAVDPAISCGQCEYCLRGDPNLCVHLSFAGHGDQDGALRQQMTWPQHCLFPLPDSLSNADGVMLEPLGVAIHSVDLAHLRVGMRVGVFGCGPIGLLILQLARLSGVEVSVVTDRLHHRLEVARAFGAKHAVLAGDKSEIQEVMAQTGGSGVDVAFEVAGQNEAVETAVAAVKPGGSVILVGIPADDRTSFPSSVARRKGITMKLVRRMKHTYPRAIQLVESARVDVRSLVTHWFPLDHSQEAFSLAQRREGLKFIIEMQ